MRRSSHYLILCLLFLASAASRGESLVGTTDIYFGHLHNHTGLSDGSGTPTEAYSAAAAAGLDFFGLSDHGEQLTADEFATMKAAADAANESGVFSTFYGFEWSSSTYGHVTVVNPDTFVSATDPATDTFTEFVTWLNTHAGIGFFNHPGRQDGAGTEFEHFTGAYSGGIVGIELWNKDSGFGAYYYNDGYTSDGRDRSGHYDEALLNGWFVGAAGSRDEHYGTWGGGSYRLAVLAGSNTRDSIYTALSSQRFYSTLDDNLELSFQVDGEEMGSGAAGGWNQVVVKAADRDGESFSQVEIIHNGYVVHTESVGGATLPTVTFDLYTQRGDYLYCKVTQSDGGEAISSPVFITSDGPDGPPSADLAVPLDNGPDDLDAADDQVIVNTTQPAFQIQLTDFEGIDDATVTDATVSISNLMLNVDYFFSYDVTYDVITLTPPADTVFGNDIYTITVSGINDLATPPNAMANTVLTVVIDTSIVPPETLHLQYSVDTMIRSAAATSSYSGNSIITADLSDENGGVSQVLVRFDDIIGGAAEQIPPYANISSATLRLRSLDIGGGGSLYAMLQDWSDTSTWESLGNGIQTDGEEASSFADDGIGANSIGDVDLDVTATLQAWVDGTMANYGWAVLPGGTDGWDIASAEHGTADYRPELIVTFTDSGIRPPVAKAGPDQTVADADGDGVEMVTLDGSTSYPSTSIVSYVWTLDGVQVAGTPVAVVPFSAPGTYIVILKVTDNAGLTDTDAAVITVEVPSLFHDDFESGGFSVGGWTASAQASVETTSAHTGTYGVLLKKSASIETTIYTGGATDATFTYWARTQGLTNESLYVEWSQDGNTWQELNTLTGTTGWAQFSHDVSSALSSFAIRFRTDGNAGNDLAMIDDIVITGAAAGSNTAPSAVDDNVTTNEDSVVTINVLSNDFDLDGDMLTVVDVAAPDHGGALVNIDNTVTYTPVADYSGSDSFAYTVSDGRGGTDTAVVTVAINSVDDPPIANAGPDQTVTDADGNGWEAVTLDGSGSYDPELNSLTYTWMVDGVTVEGEQEPSLSYSFSVGIHTVTLIVTDGGQPSVPDQAIITVQQPSVGGTMHVADLDGVANLRGASGQWSALVTITIADSSGNPVFGATVTGTWGDPAGGASTGLTGSDGKVTLSSSNMKSGSSVAFTITEVTHSALTYDSAGNSDPDGDSTGTAITVTK